MGERCGIARVDSCQVQIEIQFTHSVHSVGARDIDTVAIGRARGCTGKVVSLIRSENKERIALIDSRSLQIGEKRAEGGVVVGELPYVCSFSRTERGCSAQ